MSKYHRIVIKTRKEGRGSQTLIKDSCPFKKTGSVCTLENIKCVYGLSEVRVPEPSCPLKAGVTQEITIEVLEQKEQ